MKKVVKAVTGLAVLGILFAGTAEALPTINLIVLSVSAAWLTLVAVATVRRYAHGK